MGSEPLVCGGFGLADVSCVKQSPAQNQFAMGTSQTISICYFEEENDWSYDSQLKTLQDFKESKVSTPKSQEDEPPLACVTPVSSLRPPVR
ncbi:hypothetical protein TURU_064805 [Turdus rufiventris]|nr:hypothetical protein TURU_064805 [Turdus rufiventris]